jgi:branched-chain amino acid transport system permease protein
VGLPAWLALPATLAAVALVAALVERAILRPLSGQPVISVLMATIGLASALHGGVDAIWGGATTRCRAAAAQAA